MQAQIDSDKQTKTQLESYYCL
uniref:Uncharacterized protein n=1 Tax=Rhizophora mucronata TaxID=61149 RepID=A0A2P2N592_RHIMU